MKVLLAFILFGATVARVPFDFGSKTVVNQLEPTPHLLGFDLNDIKNIWEASHMQTTLKAIKARRPNVDLQRITGGAEATVGQFPEHILLLLQNRAAEQAGITYWCGGSLISSHWIITAAHCAYQMTVCSAYSINNVTSGPIWWSSSAQYIIANSAYTPSDPNINNDSGMIRTRTAATVTQYTAFITLPTIDAVNFVGYDATVPGFGLTSDASNATTSDVLNFVTMPVIDSSDCAPFTISSDQLCTSTTTDGGSPCPGDSGGGLFIGNPTSNDGSRILLGTVSGGSNDGCTLGYPVIYANVFYFLSWYNSTMVHYGV